VPSAVLTPPRAAPVEDAPARRSPVPFAVFGIALAGVAAATWSRSPLAYDGAPILLRTMHNESPFVTHGRIVTALLKWPTVWASQLTGSMAAGNVVFSFVYAALPVLAVALAWWFVRRDAPWLAVWAALGAFVVAAPGQVFAVSEAQTTVAFAWPLLLVTLVGAPRRAQRIGAVSLAAALVTLHPYSVLVLAGVGAVSVLGGLVGRLARSWATPWGAVLIATAVVRWLLLDPYERSQTSLETLELSYERAIRGAPMLVLLLALVTAVSLVTVRRSRLRPALGRAAVVLPVVGAVGVLAFWSSETTRWQDASAFRTWVLLVSLPFYALAVLDAWWPVPTRFGTGALTAPESPDGRSVVAVASACGFALTALLQGAGWHGLERSLERNVTRSSSVCVTREAMLPDPPGALKHWSRNALAIVLQGRDPKHVLVNDCGPFERGNAPAVVGHGRYLRADGWVRLPRPEGYDGPLQVPPPPEGVQGP
jgi:hypothetical protein